MFSSTSSTKFSLLASSKENCTFPLIVTNEFMSNTMMTSLLLENKEKTFLLEQKKDQTEEINRLKKELDQEKKDHLNEIEKLKNELEKEKNKGFFARLFGK